MKDFELLNSILDKMLLTESHEDLEFEKSELFGKDGTIADYGVTLRDAITGVVYAIDCKIDLEERKYKIDRIDIQDYSYKPPRTIDGNPTTFEVVGQFIKNNIPTIVSKAKVD
jgi:hypothetical protein